MQVTREQIKSLLLLGVLVLAGCATPSNYVPPVEERDETRTRETPYVEIDQNVGNDTAVTTGIGTAAPITPVTTAVEQPRAATESNPAVLALLASALQNQRQGAYSAAQGNLERAQRIAPRDPQVYLQLADLRRLQGQYLQAEQLALKGVAVAAGRPRVERRLWLLIADIRMEGGDSRGAQEARQKAARL